MNTKLLLDVKAAILAEPSAFRMDTWTCGTAHCIAGWALKLSGNEIVNPEMQTPLQFTKSGHSPHEAAEAALEIDEGQAEALFNLGEWPQEFQERYDVAGPSAYDEKARVAAERIDYFISVGGDRASYPDDDDDWLDDEIDDDDDDELEL